MQADNGGAQDGPGLLVGAQVEADARDLVDVRLAGQLGAIEPPQPREGGVGQLEPAIGGEDGDALLQRVERLALHPRLGVELGFQVEMLGDVIEQVGDAALRIGVDHRAQGATVGQVPHLLRRVR